MGGENQSEGSEVRDDKREIFGRLSELLPEVRREMEKAGVRPRPARERPRPRPGKAFSKTAKERGGQPGQTQNGLADELLFREWEDAKDIDFMRAEPSHEEFVKILGTKNGVRGD